MVLSSHRLLSPSAPSPPSPPTNPFPTLMPFVFFLAHRFSPRPVTMVWNLTLEPGGLTVGYTAKDDGWASARIRQTFKGTTRGTYLLCSFRSPKKKVFIITTFNITVKYFDIAFISTVWKSCRDRTKASGYSGPRDFHSNTIKCPLRFLQPQGHTACLLYSRPSPVFPSHSRHSPSQSSLVEGFIGQSLCTVSFRTATRKAFLWWNSGCSELAGIVQRRYCPLMHPKGNREHARVTCPTNGHFNMGSTPG